MPAVAAAAGAVDAEFVLVDPDPRTLRRELPGNVRVVGRLPFDRALPHCAAVVHHGGAGTALGALRVGIPQLAVPGIGDRRPNADLLAARGAALAVPARRITAAHLDRLLTDPALATAAAQVRDEIAAMPTPDAVARQVAGVE